MKVIADPVTSQRPVPVIMASNPLPALWPVSTPACNYALVSGKSGRSPLETLIDAINLSGQYAAPIVFIPEQAARKGIDQVLNTAAGKATVVLVEDHVPTGMLCAFAAVYQARQASQSRLVFLPATLASRTPSTMRRCLRALAEARSSDKDAITFLARPGVDGDSKVTFGLHNRPTKAGLQGVRRMFTRAVTEVTITDEGFEPDMVAVPVGPAVLQANALLARLMAFAPTAIQACNNALAAGQVSGAILRPASAFLTLGGGLSLMELASQSVENLFVLCWDNEISTVRNWDDPLSDAPALAQRQQQIIGLENARIIDGPAGTLLLQTGMAKSVGFPGDGSGTVLREEAVVSEIIDEGSDHALWRLRLAPGEALPVECHFHRHEQWTIASGSGLASVDGKAIEVRSGSHVAIAPGSTHALVNTGNDPLVVLEFRNGTILDDDDRIHVSGHSISA